MGDAYQEIDGIKCYAPELANVNDYFSEEYLRSLYEIEDGNFWYRSRSRVIKGLFKKHLGVSSPKNILEIGSGNGFILKSLTAFENYKLCGADIHIQGLKNSKERLSNLEFIQLDATRMPFENEYDAIGAFDVLEHIDDDMAVIRNVHKALKPEGYFLVTVPQYQWMWSNMDDIDQHKRRYSRKELKNKLSQNGFEVNYSSSFVFILFPLMVVSRLLKKSEKFQERPFEDKLTELKLSSTTNFLLESFMRIDELFIKLGFSLPFGGSLIIVARKKVD
jgi:SAM-dependent methyltransferase